jgi:hypothetical protein
MIERIDVSGGGASFPQSQVTQSPFAPSLDDSITRWPDSTEPGFGVRGSGFGKEDSLTDSPAFGDPNAEYRTPKTEKRVLNSRSRRGPKTEYRKPITENRAGRRRLPQFVQALAEQMLSQGSTAEEVARTARECGFTQTTAAKVDRWLDEDEEARERIIRRQAEMAKDLRDSISPADATEELPADLALLEAQAAASLAGTSSPRDVQCVAAIHRSLRAQLQIENDSLKRRAKRLEARKAYLTRRIEHAKMRLDHARLQVVQRRLVDLRDALKESADVPQEPGKSVFSEIVSSLCQLLGVRR